MRSRIRQGRPGLMGAPGDHFGTRRVRAVRDKAALVPTAGSAVEALGPNASFELADGPRGPMLLIRAPRLRFVAADSIEIEGRSLTLRTSESLHLEVGADFCQAVGGDRVAFVEGAERLEVSEAEIQASAGGVRVRAMHGIALDGEHVGLNDLPLPRPFGWSRLGQRSLPPRMT